MGKEPVYSPSTAATTVYNPNVLITLGSSKVEGLHGMGAGFLMKGKANFVMFGPDFDFMKEKFVWLAKHRLLWQDPRVSP